LNVNLPCNERAASGLCTEWAVYWKSPYNTPEAEDPMTNPFENNEASFLVLINDENQHSIWPDFIEIPKGWKTTHGPTSKADCLNFVESNWTDMRPRSLAQAMENSR
jgi:uncharacterized protein YbdZ (MbtH family)